MNKVNIKAENPEEIISPMLHGQFIEFLGGCIHDGIWVGEDSNIPNYYGMRKDVVDALKKLEVPVLRWPGGCYADKYHWRDGIMPYGWCRTLAEYQYAYRNSFRGGRMG